MCRGLQDTCVIPQQSCDYLCRNKVGGRYRKTGRWWRLQFGARLSLSEVAVKSSRWKDPLRVGVPPPLSLAPHFPYVKCLPLLALLSVSSFTPHAVCRFCVVEGEGHKGHRLNSVVVVRISSSLITHNQSHLPHLMHSHLLLLFFASTSRFHQPSCTLVAAFCAASSLLLSLRPGRILLD